MRYAVWTWDCGLTCGWSAPYHYAVVAQLTAACANRRQKKGRDEAEVCLRTGMPHKKRSPERAGAIAYLGMPYCGTPGFFRLMCMRLFCA